MGVWGLQIIAVDGSKIPLPNRKALLEKYGSIGRGSNSPTAIASVAFDVLNSRVLDARLEPMSADERTLAVMHMEHLKSKARTNLLYTMFVFDRGYVFPAALLKRLFQMTLPSVKMTSGSVTF